MIILGIDPGTTRIGYGVIEKKGKTTPVSYGTIELVFCEHGTHLHNLSKELQKIIQEHNPDYIGVEKLFFSKNKKTALTVAEARGVILLTALQNNIAIKQFSPTEIKSTITGWGKSDKKTVEKCVALSLGLSSVKGYDDASDALAVALRTSFEV
jgi:crossover junction endodeoxyribonuclease RuvC